MSLCTGETCCSRWIELSRAYNEGRQHEVAVEVARVIKRKDVLENYPVVIPECRYARKLVAQLKADGWLTCEGKLFGWKCAHEGGC